jgi:type IV secretory pathway TrbF-like protein
MFNPFKAAFSAGSKAMGGHDFQSDKVDDYSNGQPILTPFQRARQEWDDRIGAPVVRSRNWRLAFFTSSGTNLILAGALVYAVFFRPPEIWGIPTNEHGVVAGVAERFAAKRYEPTRDQVAADLAQWLEWVRTRPADGVKLRADIEKAYVFLDDTAKRKLNEYNKRFDPFAAYNTPDKLAKKTVTKTFPKVLPMEGNSYHATWTETVWEYGQAKPSYTVTATFTATATGQTNQALINLNPAGTTIHDFDWRSDVTS